MTPLDEAAWLGEDHEIVRRSRARERALTDHPVVEHRVVGPPGTGKTSYLARQAPIAADKYGVDGVLLSSLTRAAALEIAGRDTPIPRHMIGTLHAHCYRALDRPALAETTEGIRAWNAHAVNSGWAPRLLMEQKATVGDLDHAPQEPDLGAEGTGDGDRLRSLLALHRARMTDPAVYTPDLAEFNERWTAWKRDTNHHDFTDLIQRCVDRGVGAPGDPAVIMLDEAQDYSRLEMTLARRWAQGCEQLVTVADPNQALYTWRGASPETLFEGPEASLRVLEQSYRVPRAVHAYAVRWIRQMPGYRHFEYRPRGEDGEVRCLTDPDFGWCCPDALLDELTAATGDGTAMVAASCGYMLAPLLARLRAHGVPFSNPWRPNHGGWNPLRGAERLLAFLRPDRDTWGDQARFWTYDELRRWVDPLGARGLLSRGAKTWLESKCTVDKFGESSRDREATAQQVVDLFAGEDAAEAAWNMDVEWWFANHLSSRRSVSEFPVEVWRRRGGAALRAPSSLFVGTVHSFKGSEASSVYLYPDLSRAAYGASWDKPRTRASTYRTFYVGMTRARQRLTLLPASGAEYVPLPHPNGGTT